MSKQRAVIIGAGIGGIATANLLAKAGYSVTVYEKNNQPGGRAGSLEVDGFRFDTGPSWYLMPEVFEHYFSLFGRHAQDELDLIRLSPAYKVFFEHQPPLTIASNITQDMTTFESIESGAGQKLKEYVDQGDVIYKLSLRHFLYSNFTHIADILKPDVLARGPQMARLASTSIDSYVSRFVQDQRLKQILEYPMVFLGTSPFDAPAIYSLMSALDFREGVFYPRGGMYSIIERLIAIGEELGVSYHYNSPVAHIATRSGVAAGITLEDDTTIPADIVISNADLHFTETTLLNPIDQSYPQSYWTNKQAGPSALLMYLGVQGSLPEFEHHNLFFVDDWKTNFEAIYKDKTIPQPASIYVCKPSATDPTVAPAGHENIFVLVPLPAGVSIDDHELETLSSRYLDQLEAATGVELKSRIVSKHLFGPDDFVTKFHSWQATALGPSHVLKQSAFFRTPNKSKKVKNLYYVGGSTTPGIGLPMCLISAELVYKRLAGETKGGPISDIQSLTGDE